MSQEPITASWSNRTNILSVTGRNVNEELAHPKSRKPPGGRGQDIQGHSVLEIRPAPVDAIESRNVSFHSSIKNVAIPIS